LAPPHRAAPAAWIGLLQLVASEQLPVEDARKRRVALCSQRIPTAARMQPCRAWLAAFCTSSTASGGRYWPTKGTGAADRPTHFRNQVLQQPLALNLRLSPKVLAIQQRTSKTKNSILS